jgi:ABC-type sugar transport system, ATPase component
MSDSSDQLVLMEGINKSFPGVQALIDGFFELRSGEVHALCGENGAGKSTLMKILAGVYQKDSGKIFYNGREVDIPNPRAAQLLGISMIHQELNLMNHLSVAHNIFIGREPRRAFGLLLDEQLINQQTSELFAQLHIKLDPRTRVADLSVAQQQMVEIAKALSFDSRVLIMDEPTAALTNAEIEDLFRIIGQLRERGVGIVYISHRMDEIKRISDRVTVMRDSRYIATLPTASSSIDQIINLMVGRTIYESTPEVPEEYGEVALEVRNLSRAPVLHDINFTLRRGEILGLAGLMGAGRTEVARAIFGADPRDSGEIFVHGRKVTINSPYDAVRAGIGYLSEDRKRYGLALGMDVEANTVMASLKDFLRFRTLVDRIRARFVTDQQVSNLGIKTPSLQQAVRHLSGGNQQKVIIGKWLTADSDILIFDEPTRGIDVGAKNEIYHLLNSLAAQGKAILMISSELPEILRMSHRVIVMCEGRITGEMPISEASQERIMQYATQREAVVS